MGILDIQVLEFINCALYTTDDSKPAQKMTAKAPINIKLY